MKSELLFSATAGTIALMLSSCSADIPVANNTSDGAITYSVTTANQTRAAHSYGASNLPDGFRIWAKHEGEQNAYINGDYLEKNSSNIYTDKHGTRYWPEAGDLDFYAVADGNYNPYNDSEKQDQSSKPKLFFDNNGNASSVTGNDVTAKVKGYTITDEISNQLDLMYAVAKEPTYNKAVNLNFRHALSQICFNAKNENPNVIITIKSITVQNVFNIGTYTLPEKSTNGNAINDSETHGTWELCQTDKTNYTITFTNGIDIEYNTLRDLTNVNNLTNVLNLLPQEMRKGNASRISLKLDIEVFNNASGTKGSKIYPINSTTNNGIIIPLGTDWEEGNRYTYTLIFADDWKDANIRKITYDVTSDDYITDNNLPVINNHEAVLMRSDPPLYFATTNIGADNPTDAGFYFWWGDIVGHKATSNNSKNGITTDFSFDYNNSSITTENKTKDELKSILNGDNLKPEKDAAHTKWGGSWRMPTKEDFKWLIESCKWQVEKDNTNKTIGFYVTSNDTEGRIYLPAASCFQEGIFGGKPSDPDIFLNQGFYWSSTINADDTGTAFRLQITFQGSPNVGGSGLRHNGFPIRPVSGGWAN